MGVVSSRCWSTIAYEESCDLNKVVSNFRRRGLGYAISPLHDVDVDDSGDFKKAHYHIIIYLPRAFARSSVERLLIDSGTVGLERVINSKAMLRYCCHLDEIDKPRYNIDDLKLWNIPHGDISCLYHVDVTLADLCDLCLNDKVSSLRELSRLYGGDSDALKLISRNSYYLNIILNERLKEEVYSNG